jgi:hypothetical protein
MFFSKLPRTRLLACGDKAQIGGMGVIRQSQPAKSLDSHFSANATFEELAKDNPNGGS